VALSEETAAFVSFQWQQASLPPAQNDHSAASPLRLATHFSGNIATYATIAVTTATFLIFAMFSESL